MNEQVGRYRILGKLGKGAMGVVYLAEDPVLSRRVAIKTVELAEDDKRSHAFLRDRLVRDGRAAAGLSHPNIVSVYDVLEEGAFGYLVMEYIAGECLASYLARVPLPDTPFVTRVLREMASALDYTHARGIIHRDIKPANVMLDSNAGGAAKIMDFGIARISDTRTMTPAGMVMGTLEYMAPEQIKGEPVDGRADQFALAAVAYEMLTGCTLFGEQTFATLAYKIVNEMPPGLRTHSPGLPKGVEEVVARGLRKPPAERFQTCGGFVAALERAFAGEVPPTAQATQSMSIPPELLAPRAPVPPASTPMFVLPPPSQAATGPSPVSGSPIPTPASYAPTEALVVTPPASGRRRRVIIGIVFAALAVRGGLLYWKHWSAPARPAAPPVETFAEVPDLPSGAQPVTRSAGGSPKQKPSPPAAEIPTPGQSPVIIAPPAPPQVQIPNPVVTPPPAQAGVPESSNDSPPGASTPSDPDPGETKIGQPARAAYRRGEEMVKSNRYSEAIQEFNRALDRNPNFLRAYFARGLAYLHQNQPSEAFSDFNELVRRQPGNAMAVAQRGICHARLHDEEAAMADYNQALGMRSDLPGALNGRGLVYLHRKQYPKAIQDFTSAIQFSPNYGWAYLNRAHAEQAAGNQKAAQEDLKKAKDLRVTDPK